MPPFSVAQFLEFLNAALSTAVFPEGVAVEGEVAEYRVSQERWIWFKLKDKEATVDCFATVWQLRTPLEDGMQVRLYGRPKVHPKSGRFSLNVERAELVGEGALRRAYELLKRRLAEEGVFAPERKRPLPRFPRRIGLITSREAAAYSDFLRILGNRWGGVEIVLAHVQVQGREAVGDIVRAFRWFNAHPSSADVLVLTRGGGSLEDLHAFNDEATVRAVFSSKIPVVVGVGHERDETLADFAADVRASTPTNAAELVVPDRSEIAAALRSAERHLEHSLRLSLESRVAGVRHAVSVLERRALSGVADLGHLLKDFGSRLAAFRLRAETRARVVDQSAALLHSSASRLVERERARLEAEIRLLAGLDPRRLLARGYAIVRAGGQVIKAASQASVGTVLDIALAEGRLSAKTTSSTKNENG